MRKLLPMVASLLLLASALLAQNTRTVKGKVTDESGAPLLGVTISVPNSRTGTVTNVKGEFSLSVPANAQNLKVSFIGYETKQVTITGENLTVSLAPDTKSISEVVVVGYGTQRRKDLTGNIASVKGSVVAQQPVQSFEAGLGGRVSGVQITIPNGVVNNPPVFRIRGTNSLSLSSYPLIVIDGVPTFTGDIGATSAPANPLSSINPADIESIDVAKDAAASAIYGSRAANGVVFVTTKKGRAGRPKVSYDGWVGQTEAVRLPKLLNAEQYMLIKNEGARNANQQDNVKYLPIEGADGKMVDTRWYDYVYRKAYSHSHSVSVSGGTDLTSYYFSAGYTKQEGILKKNDFLRKNILVNLDQKLGKALTVGGKIAFANANNLSAGASGSLNGEAFASGGFARLALLNAPNVGAYNKDGSYNIKGQYLGAGNNTLSRVGIYNPAVLMDLDHSNTESNQIQSNVYAQLKPLEWLTLRSQYAIDYVLMDNDIYQNPIQGDGQTSNGDATHLFANYKRWVWSNTAQFDKTFGDHTVGLLVGEEEQRTQITQFGINRTNQSDPFFKNTEGGWANTYPSGLDRTENYLFSLFARLNYSYKDKYIFSANVRGDQYSALKIKRGTFYGLSVGWEIAKEDFWQNSNISKVVNSLRLRGSYGKVGNTAGIGDFGALSFYTSSLYNGAAALYYSQSGNNDLAWEVSKKSDVGISFGLLNNRVTGEVNYYKNNIDGLILFVRQPPSAGVPNDIPMNVGSMYNKGWEITLGATPVANKNFSWNTSINLSFNKNEITALSDGVTEIPHTTASNETTNISKIGYPAGTIFVTRTAGVDPATGRRIFINAQGEKVYYQYYSPTGDNWTYADGKRAPGVSSADAVPYMNTNPKMFGGFDNTIRFKNFELNALITFQTGYYVYYGTNAGLRDQRFWNNHVDVLRRWQKPGDVTDIPKVVYGDNVSNGSAIPIDANVFKGDFAKLRTLSLTYIIPESAAKKVFLSGARVYVRGNNLAILTKYPGPDPEVSSNGNSSTTQGVDRNTLANGRTITVGVNVNF